MNRVERLNKEPIQNPQIKIHICAKLSAKYIDDRMMTLKLE